jgi:hypothetical protein
MGFETDVAYKFKLENQVKDVEIELTRIEERLIQLDL